jgi:hypothetical protein
VLGVDQLQLERPLFEHVPDRFQYEPVYEENVRVRLRRPRPLGAGVRTQATTSSLPMSIPAHRSISTSTNGLLTIGTSRAGSAGPTDQRRCEACHEDNSSRCREGP